MQEAEIIDPGTPVETISVEALLQGAREELERLSPTDATRQALTLVIEALESLVW